jgi:hypothetical protein
MVRAIRPSNPRAWQESRALSGVRNQHIENNRVSKSDLNLGTCCACKGIDNVRNIIMHHKPAPVPGTGWGCVVCNLPGDGALSVVCDNCANHGTEITEVCMGYPIDNVRVPIHALRDVYFDHDFSLHPEVTVGKS